MQRTLPAIGQSLLQTAELAMTFAVSMTAVTTAIQAHVRLVMVLAAVM